MNESQLMEKQEEDQWKRNWLRLAEAWFPIGMKVFVVSNGVYAGMTGTVVDYDLGAFEEYPLVSVLLDHPLIGGYSINEFGDDEITPFV